MIQWWGWLLIWAGLVLALLLVLGFLAYRLFRKAIDLMHEVSAVVDKTAALDVEVPELSQPQIAILTQMSEIRAQRDTRQRRRSELKIERHERRLARAKRITKRDANSAQWPAGWS